VKSQVPTNASKADSKLQDIVREAAEYLAKLEAERVLDRCRQAAERHLAEREAA